jgi:hypothetical protein
MIDGKVLANAASKYTNNTQGTNPSSTTPISRGDLTTNAFEYN